MAKDFATSECISIGMVESAICVTPVNEMLSIRHNLKCRNVSRDTKRLVLFANNQDGTAGEERGDNFVYLSTPQESKSLLKVVLETRFAWSQPFLDYDAHPHFARAVADFPA